MNKIMTHNLLGLAFLLLIPCQVFAANPATLSQDISAGATGDFDVYVGESAGGTWSAIRVNHKTGEAWYQMNGAWNLLTESQPIPQSYYDFRLIFYKIANNGTWSIWRIDSKSGQVWDNTKNGTSWAAVSSTPANTNTNNTMPTTPTTQTTTTTTPTTNSNPK